MPALSVLLKPASGSCGLRCHYCFYADESRCRSVENFGFMPEETLRQVVSKCLAYADTQCTFAFQGGEPTLRGLPFFQRLIPLEKRYRRGKTAIYHAIQTNGMALDGAWASFFRKNQFLVGLSLDGPRDLHDANRVDASGQGTFDAVLAAARLLQGKDVPYNILTVVTEATASRAKELFSFFMAQGFLYQQYIPCLDPLGAPRGGCPGSLTPAGYGRFLTDLFDAWYEARLLGHFVYIRYFENLAARLLGQPAECCGMGGCTPQLVVEADGSVYPCDFYMLDDYCLGNFHSDTVSDMARRWEDSPFVREAGRGLERCAACQWYPLCRGGCRRDRQGLSLHQVGENYFCSAYRSFFPHAVPRLAALLRRNGHSI